MNSMKLGESYTKVPQRPEASEAVDLWGLRSQMLEAAGAVELWSLRPWRHSTLEPFGLKGHSPWDFGTTGVLEPFSSTVCVVLRTLCGWPKTCFEVVYTTNMSVFFAADSLVVSSYSPS